MSILIATAGSRGDVAPYTGLGAELRRAGYDVTLATTDTFAHLAHDAGLEFRGLPADTRAHGGVRGRRDLMRAAAVFVTELGQGFADAVADGTDLLLLSTTTAPLGWHLTEATGIPSLGVYLQPTAPTRDFPPAATGARSLGSLGNRTAARFALRMTDRVYEQATRDLRHRLQLPPLAASAMRATLRRSCTRHSSGPPRRSPVSSWSKTRSTRRASTAWRWPGWTRPAVSARNGSSTRRPMSSWASASSR